MPATQDLRQKNAAERHTKFLKLRMSALIKGCIKPPLHTAN